ncbi:MAG TPA: LEA type 2 family protein [Balneolaceae bacterium]|nr:LEA type 2 family protein [Balneolaceae bacterium]
MTKFLSALLLLFFITGCAALKDLANIQKPSLEYSNISVQSINFNQAELLFNFEVNNPNPIGITASGYSYDFLVNSNSFLSGNQDRNVNIGSSRSSVLQVPVTLQYTELLNTFRSLLQSDEFNYALSTEFLFDIPGLGQQRLPANASGRLPIPKIPGFEFAGFNIESISPSGADMELKIGINNPNAFPILLNSASYVLNVNGREWLNTSLSDAVRVSSDGSSEIVIPVQLNAVQMGSVLFDLMRGSTEFDYSLNGNADVGAQIEGFSFTENILFDREGVFRR